MLAFVLWIFHAPAAPICRQLVGLGKKQEGNIIDSIERSKGRTPHQNPQNLSIASQFMDFESIERDENEKHA